MYVRDDTLDPIADFNNAIEYDGDDWFEFISDSEREEGDHLCTSSSGSGYQCSKIKCIVRRRMVTEDADDFSFAPTAAANAGMEFPAG
jgi:hypothetical protein